MTDQNMVQAVSEADNKAKVMKIEKVWADRIKKSHKVKDVFINTTGENLIVSGSEEAIEAVKIELELLGMETLGLHEPTPFCDHFTLSMKINAVSADEKKNLSLTEWSLKNRYELRKLYEDFLGENYTEENFQEAPSYSDFQDQMYKETSHYKQEDSKTTIEESINIEQFAKAKENEIIEYAVYRDSLVYLFKLRGELRAGVLQTFNTPSIQNGDVLYINLKEKFMKATEEDFNHYRVSSKGHL
jgi:hypothetical protein